MPDHPYNVLMWRLRLAMLWRHCLRGGFFPVLVFICCIKVDASNKLVSRVVSICGSMCSWGSSNSGSSWITCSSWALAFPFSCSLALLLSLVSFSLWCSSKIFLHFSAASSSSRLRCSSGCSGCSFFWLLIRGTVTSTFCFFGSSCGTSSWSSALLLSANLKLCRSSLHAVGGSWVALTT